MAKTRLFAKLGFLSKGYSPGGYDLTRWLKESLISLKVPLFDDCCDSAKIGRPVQYNQSLGVLETYSSDSNAFEAITSSGILVAAQTSLSGAGAIPVTSYYTAVTTTGADALTIDDGTFHGQRKKIKMVVDGGDGTLTGASLGYTITFNDVNDYVELIWDAVSEEWLILENNGCTVA